MTIGAEVGRARRGNPLAWLSALALVVKQHRLVEVLYGCMLFFVAPRRPAVPDDTWKSLISSVGTEPSAQDVCLDDLRGMYPDVLGHGPSPSSDDFRVRINPCSVAANANYVVAGEYGDASPRLFLLSREGVRSFHCYDSDSRVRHIHCCTFLDAQHLLVSTGDSAKYLDRYVIRNGSLEREARLCRWLGGFTAAAHVNGDVYLGTDYSERPNYLWRLRDRKKFFYPGASYTRYTSTMQVVSGRYVLVRISSLFDSRTCHCVFDSRLERFVYAD